jgi:hypothetical protein
MPTIPDGIVILDGIAIPDGIATLDGIALPDGISLSKIVPTTIFLPGSR